MKLGFKFATHVWAYHIMAAILGFVFISTMSGALAIIISSLLVVGITAIALNEGAYQGEKGCTVAATIEKQVQEGRKVDEAQKKMTFRRSVAVWTLIFGCLPFILLSTANIVTEQNYDRAAIEESGEQAGNEAFAFDYDGSKAAEHAASDNPVNSVTRLVFAPFVGFYPLMSKAMLDKMFFVFSLPVAAAMAAGYLCGPWLRKRKLHDIAAGKKRKMRNLKVNKKPRQPKAEV